mgnify:CR=1 FL=1
MIRLTIREQDPLKQGLKPDSGFSTSENENIREQDPLKQGLKLISGLGLNPRPPNSWARSIKTRIETTSLSKYQPTRPFIREQDPLKQGLKLITDALCLSVIVFVSKIH